MRRISMAALVTLALAAANVSATSGWVQICAPCPAVPVPPTGANNYLRSCDQKRPISEWKAQRVYNTAGECQSDVDDFVNRTASWMQKEPDYDLKLVSGQCRCLPADVYFRKP